MAANKDAAIPQGNTPELRDVGELKQLLNVPESTYQGVAASENWKPGRQVTQAEFEKAVDRFNGSPISGKKVRKNA
ncbi:hypothetical protein V3851_23725 [Paenibacillus sp. M1]|uniref:Uncharacterized protein n=1 Tax=Paenibacillus haidiansis TaxID=1574488 RepID=A0ABU7VYP0_9BACL